MCSLYIVVLQYPIRCPTVLVPAATTTMTTCTITVMATDVTFSQNSCFGINSECEKSPPLPSAPLHPVQVLTTEDKSAIKDAHLNEADERRKASLDQRP